MRRLTVVLAAFLAAVPALAHDSIGPNGGRVTDMGSFHAELLVKGSTVELYVTDSTNKAIATEGHKGLAILAVGGKSERVDLLPSSGNKLIGTSPVTLPPNAKGVVRLNSPDGKTSQAKFD